MYDVGIKCTLMANEPNADIELLFYTVKDRKVDSGSKSGCETPTMRVRLLRRRQLVEISRQVASVSAKGHANSSLVGEEWTKKVLVVPGGDFSVVNQGTLGEEEIGGLAHAIAFVSVCRIIEDFQRKEPVATAIRPPEKPPSRSPRRSTIQVDSSGSAEEVLAMPASFLTSTLSQIDVPPRPPKFSSLEHAVKQHSEAEFSSASYEGFETRFIPSVGWCVRYYSSGRAGKYRMMFFDGAMLEVDVDGECVEFADSVTEEVVR
jgi:polo-like kinase 4